MKLGSPVVKFTSFWNVYNQLCDAVDSEFLSHATTDTPTRSEESITEEGVEQLPLGHLHPCVFRENGIPAAQIYEGKVGPSFTPSHP